MNVGIDGRLLATQVTGIGRYTFELTKELIHEDGFFNIYSPMPPTIGNWRKENINVRSSHLPNRIGKMLWSQTMLPYWANNDNLDVFWGPTHRIPKLLSNKTARVVTIHDLAWKYASETMRFSTKFVERTFMPEAIKIADIIITDAQSTASQILLEYPFTEGRIAIINLGTSVFPSPYERAHLSKYGVKGAYFLFVGTLEPRKNLIRLLHAYKALSDSHKDRLSFIIAGGKGWGNINLHQLIKDLNLEKNVFITNYVDDRALATLYKYATFLAMPSLYEGFGLPLAEAMSFGIPVLTSNISSLPEVAGPAGCLVNPLNMDEMISGLMRIGFDSEYRQSLAIHAVNQSKKFDWKNAAKLTFSAFKEAINIRKKLNSKVHVF